ncbi:TPA: Fic/DOC family protein [Pseudomonas aeruginosa]
MSRYELGQDPYTYENSNILINISNIRNQEELDLFEKDAVAQQVDNLDFIGPPYDLDTLCDIHYVLFCNVYMWAGELRTTGIKKGNTRFWQPERIRMESEKVFSEIANIVIQDDVDKHTLCNQLAIVYCELNMIHPFREGNGRAQRILFEFIIACVGYQIDWSLVSSEKWLSANIAGVICNYQPMEEIFLMIISKFEMDF